jgi:phage terminase large subunit-like protein
MIFSTGANRIIGTAGKNDKLVRQAKSQNSDRLLRLYTKHLNMEQVESFHDVFLTREAWANHAETDLASRLHGCPSTVAAV